MCKYCENYADLREDYDEDYDLDRVQIDGHYLYIETYLEGLENDEKYIIINFCPKCGRDLRESDKYDRKEI